MSTYARTFVFLFGVVMLVAGLGYGLLGGQTAVIVGMEHGGYEMQCGPAFYEPANAHVGDRFSGSYYNRVPGDEAINAEKNAEQQRRCDHARNSAGNSVRNIVAFAAFLIFFAFLRNPFSKRPSGRVSLTEFDRVTRQAQADQESRKNARKQRYADAKAEYLRKVEPIQREDQS